MKIDTKGSQRIWVLSGEGDGEGTFREYRGARTERAISSCLRRERCNGDRWARAIIEADPGQGIDFETGEDRVLPEAEGAEEIKPKVSFYGTDNETYWVGPDGRTFLIQSVDGLNEPVEVDGLPAEALPLPDHLCRDLFVPGEDHESLLQLARIPQE